VITAAHRLLLVHAHPDDETIGSGATMAHYAAAGAHVTLVTCTLGEEGEILVDDHAHRAADRDDSLGEHRAIELADAMVALGVTDHRLLGHAGKYRDSGMMGLPDNDDPAAFWQADLLAASADLVAVIREVRPQVLVTYDDFGGYGHPDHIQAHRVAMYAALLAAAPSFRPDLGAAWDIAKIYWTAFPKSFVREGIAALRAMGEDTGFAAMDPDDIPFACDDEIITTVIDAQGESDKKMAAMRAHATQISVEDGFFALSNKLGSRAIGVEFYRLVRGETAGERDEVGRETDLFAGI
jgi:N-acetyl-1-D-myo-inositol-2-amino-2-deoxy-alpha-D-glucopyranoside deacetylase